MSRQPTNKAAQRRAQVSQQIQETTGQSVKSPSWTKVIGDQPTQDALQQDIRLEVVKLPNAKKCFVLLLRSFVVERSFAWMARFHRLACDYERLPQTLVGLHLLAFVILILHRFVHLMAYRL